MTEHKHYVTVVDKETLYEMKKHIEESEVLAYDTETNSLNVRKGKIVGWSVSGKVGYGYYLPTRVWDAEKQELVPYLVDGVEGDIITKTLLKYLKGKKLVCHNGSFDLRFTKNYYGIDLIEDLWVETTVLVHTVQEEGAGMGVFGLKPLAVSVQEEIGLNVEEAANKEQIELKASIKANGGTTTKINFEIYKADLDILSKYGAADTDLTLRICYYFLKRLKEEGLEKFYFEEEVMPVYRELTIPMEEQGVKLDMPLIHKAYKEILKDLEINKKVVLESLMKTSEAKDWIVHKSQQVYPPNKGKWSQILAQRYSLPLPKSTKTGNFSLNKKEVEKLEDSPVKQFLLTEDIKVLPELEVARISMHLWKEDNDGEYINIQSKQHLGEIVFDFMGIKPLTHTKKGSPQFDSDMIEELSKTYTWAENLRVYNKLLKIKSTYIERYIENNEDGTYYPYFKQHGTVSGRYGSDLQQLPKPKEEGEDVPIIVHYNNLIRAFFIAGEGRKFIDSDYESLEPHCFASVTRDVKLQEIFNNGWDFYSTVAIQTEKLEGVSPDKKADNYLKKVDPVKRNQAKAYSLGIAYGMEAFALGKTLNITQKEADVLVQGYLNGFPQLKEWRENSRDFINKNGYIKNYVGRVRHLPVAKKVYEKFGEDLLDWRFRQSLEKVYGKQAVLQLYRDYRNARNNALNFQLQSLAASVVNRAGVQINRKATELGVDAKVIAQIHDQLVINVREDQAEYFAPIVQEIMETNLVLPGVTLKSPGEISDNMRDGH